MSEKTTGFSGRVYVVTGSTQGIGAEVAIALARAGAEGVVICGRNEEGGARVKAAVEGEGAGCEYVPADLSEVDDCRAVIASCDERFGRLDGLVNAAGMTDRGTIEDTSVELWDRMFAVNARAPFFLMQDAIALMRKHGITGVIVNIITMSSHGGQPFISAYSASKGARSYIVRGKGNRESFLSCSHGAGRRMSRTQAKKRFTVEDHARTTEGVECRKDSGVIDETPDAYKDIDAVMAAQADLVEAVHTLKQVICVKG